MKEDLQLQFAGVSGWRTAAREVKLSQIYWPATLPARDLLVELTNTRDVIVAHEATIKVPETREFYWSKIQREISREAATAPVASFSLVAWLRRALVPAGAFAAVAIAALLESAARWGGMGNMLPRLQVMLPPSPIMITLPARRWSGWTIRLKRLF